MTSLAPCSLRSFGFGPATLGLLGVALLASVMGCASIHGGADGPTLETPPTDAIGDRPTSVPGVTLKSYGIPNRHLKNTTVALLDPGAGPNASILQGTHTHGEGRMVRFQPSTGETTYLPMRGALGSWAIASNGDGSAYAGSHQTGYVFHLEAGADSLRRIAVPRPTELAYDWVFSVAKASDGWMYFGTYPEGALLRYSPDSHTVEELGQLIEDTDRAQYVRHLNTRFDGKIYAGLGAVPELIEIDLDTQEHTAMLPPRYRDRSFVYFTSRFQDMLLAVVSPNDRLLFFDTSSRELIREVAPPDGSPGFMRFASDSFVTYNGRLLLGTTDNDRLWEYDFDREPHAPDRGRRGDPDWPRRRPFPLLRQLGGNVYRLGSSLWRNRALAPDHVRRWRDADARDQRGPGWRRDGRHLHQPGLLPSLPESRLVAVPRNVGDVRWTD